MIQGILLAAGASRRFGSDKLLLPVGNTPMVIACARKLLPAVDNITVVINSSTGRMNDLLKAEGLSSLTCDTAAQGMSYSLKAGISATREADSWIIALADMPFIKTATFLAVSTELRNGAPLVVPYYSNRRGHPVGFGSRYMSELMCLEGDHGASPVLEHHADDIHRIDCHDPAIHIDIDTPEDRRKYTPPPFRT